MWANGVDNDPSNLASHGNRLPWVIASFGELKMLTPHISSYELLKGCVR
jgi:hypothetical protein